jgi:hypothetical protein
MITANTLNVLILHTSPSHAVLQGTIVANGAFAGLANTPLVNAIAIPGATMTLTSNASHNAEAALLVAGTVLTGNTSAAVGTVVSVSGPATGVYTYVVKMASGTFANTEYIIGGALDGDPEAQVTSAVNNAKVVLESIEWSTTGVVELSWANNATIGAFTGTGKSHHTWTKTDGAADPNILLTTRGIASNGAATVIATVRKLAGYEGW